MKPFVTHKGIIAPLDRVNVDTDLIIPKQFLKSIYKTGFGENLFDQIRYLDEGQPGMDNSVRPVNPDFILNKPSYKKASILLGRDNFGCGSSREHAVWALLDYGFRAVIAPSFADIFFNNCFKNGVLPIALGKNQIDDLFIAVSRNKGLEVSVDLGKQEITYLENNVHFDIEGFRKHRLLNGLDDIALTLEKQDIVKAYEQKRAREYPWLYSSSATN